ncbi:MAG TPA: GlxA family transcriptional regulator [Hyphomicrobium sp.]|nr:GlxA family transcriptional regulator [Hyphomicrobium sp.]
MARTVTFFIFDQFQLLDAAGPIAAFELAGRGINPAPYRLKVIARDAGPIMSSSGISMPAEDMRAQRAIDTLIVVGGLGTRQAVQCSETLRFVQRSAKKVRRLCSVCSGSYVLGAAGLLAGRRVTTHWARSQHFARAFPDVRLEADKIYIRDGHIWTSAGITAGIDLSLALIGEDFGEAVAKRVAQDMVVFHRRPGGQSQFSALLDISQAEGRFADLLSWMREHVGARLTVEVLAERVHMSPRNFSRAFVEATGVTPAKAVERVRLEVARERVEGCSEPIEVIARVTGFGDPERMRRAFMRAFGQPPQSLRRTARSNGS